VHAAQCICTLKVIFFFQAEDGIRDATVTGVQTCALPILCRCSRGGRLRRAATTRPLASRKATGDPSLDTRWSRQRSMGSTKCGRSEERRVGKEGRGRGEREHEKKKTNKKIWVRVGGGSHA